MERKVYELDCLYHLLAAMMRRALKDARRGDEPALLWLNEFYPEWRKYGT